MLLTQKSSKIRAFTMENEEKKRNIAKKKKKITPERLKNIALYYLQRFDSSEENLKQVLKKRVFDYAFENPDFDKQTAYEWIEKIISDFRRVGYLNDNRYAEQKILTYLAAGKPERYIRQKLQQKGVKDDIVDKILAESEIDEETSALKFARRKKIGPFRSDWEQRKLCRQKDMATMVRAGFGYDVVQRIIGGDFFDENI